MESSFLHYREEMTFLSLCSLLKPLNWWWGLGISQRLWETRRIYFTSFDCHLFERIRPLTPSRCRKKIFRQSQIVSESIWSEELEVDFHIFCRKDCCCWHIRNIVVFLMVCLLSDLHLLTAVTKMTYLKGTGDLAVLENETLSWKQKQNPWLDLKKKQKKKTDTFAGSLCKISLHFPDLGFLIC